MQPDLPQNADRPERGSLDDLRQRLERLPPGHPSSPYNDDLTRKPPPARLKDLELPFHDTNGGVRHHDPEPDADAITAGAGGNGSRGHGLPADRPAAAVRVGAEGWTDPADEEAAGLGLAAAGLRMTAGLGPANGMEAVAGPGGGESVEMTARLETAARRAGTGLEPADGRGAAGGLGPADPYGTADEFTASNGSGAPDAFGADPLGADALGADGGLGTGEWSATSSWDPAGLGGASDLDGREWDGASEWDGATASEWDGTSASEWDGTSAGEWDAAGDWDGSSEWDGAGDPQAAFLPAGEPAWADPERGADTGYAVIEPDQDDLDEPPRAGPDGSWEWNGRYLTPDEYQIAEQALSRCRVAEGRNMFGSYGHSGLTPAMRRIEAQLDSGGLLPDTETQALKSPDRFRERFADLILRHPDKTAEELSLDVHDGIRYAFVFDTDSYAEATLQAHSRLKGHGFELEARWNGWDSREYKGINSRWRDPAHDVVFEVQFHTASSWDAWQRGHDAYKRIIDPRTPPDERARLRAVHAANSAGIPVPPRCTAIPDFRREAL